MHLAGEERVPAPREPVRRQPFRVRNLGARVGEGPRTVGVRLVSFHAGQARRSGTSLGASVAVQRRRAVAAARSGLPGDLGRADRFL